MYGRLFAAALLIGIVVAACSGNSRSGANPLPATCSDCAQRAVAAATPPVTAPVKIVFAYTNPSTTTTWAGPTASPVTTTNPNDTGTYTDYFTYDKKAKTYNVLATVKSKLGYTEVDNVAIDFPPNYRKGTAQIILSDNLTFTQGPFSETGQDTYPQGQNSFDFPLTTGRRWSAAASHTSFVNEALSGSGAFQENVATNTAADGQYVGQTNFSSLNGAANHDNYASTTAVSAFLPSAYTLSEPAAGVNTLTQTFWPPNGNKIVVTSSGKNPLPVKPGTTKVPDWYPGSGALPYPLYSDDYVVTGPAKMPSPQCGKRAGQTATKVVETFFDVDPVQGTFDTNLNEYYLGTLATGQYWFECITINIVDRTYANGWVMNAGGWGKLTSKTVSTLTYLATTPAPSKSDLATIPDLRVLPALMPLAMREGMRPRR